MYEDVETSALADVYDGGETSALEDVYEGGGSTSLEVTTGGIVRATVEDHPGRELTEVDDSYVGGKLVLEDHPGRGTTEVEDSYVDGRTALEESMTGGCTEAELEVDRVGVDVDDPATVVDTWDHDEVGEALLSTGSHVPKPAWQPVPQYSGPVPQNPN